MPTFLIDMRKIEHSYTTLDIEADNLAAAKRAALDQAVNEPYGVEDIDWTVDECDMTAWDGGVRDDDNTPRMRVGDAAYMAAGAPTKPD